MPISNSSPQQKDVVIIQRNSTNEYYGETHISGSKLIFYTDSSGYINADESASFYTIFPPPETGGLTPGSIYPITSSWAISASWASQSLSASYVPNLYPQTEQISASWASSSISASYLNGTIYHAEMVITVVTPATSITFDFAKSSMLTLNISGPASFTSSNLSAGRMLNCKILSGANPLTASWPSDWVWFTSGSVSPATLASGKIGLISLTSYGTTDADVCAIWVNQS